MSALVYADHDNAVLAPATRHAITAARQMATSVHVIVAGRGCGAVAQAAARIEGVDRVIVAEDEGLAHHLPENVAPLLVQLAADYGHVVAPATSTGKNVLPRVAALLDVSQVSEISAVIAPDVFERPIYAGNAIAVVKSTDSKRVVTVRATKFAAAADRDAACPVVAMRFDQAACVSRFIEQDQADPGRPDLTTAAVVVSGGRGMGSKDSFGLLESLACALGGAVGASRAAVDAGFAPSDTQVGQTGKVVAPKLYIAVGISGAIQHLAGMKDSGKIIAINKDADAPIFQVADIGWVGDLFEALPQLTQAVDAK